MTPELRDAIHQFAMSALAGAADLESQAKASNRQMNRGVSRALRYALKALVYLRDCSGSAFCACGAQWHGRFAESPVITKHRKGLTPKCLTLSHDRFAELFLCDCKNCQAGRQRAGAEALAAQGPGGAGE